MAKRNEQRFPYFGAAATSDLENLLGRGGWAISLYIQLSQRKQPAANQTTAGAVRGVRLDRALRDECEIRTQPSDPVTEPARHLTSLVRPSDKMRGWWLLILHQRVVAHERSPSLRDLRLLSVQRSYGAGIRPRQVKYGIGNTHLFRRQSGHTKGLTAGKEDQLVHFSESWWGGRTRRVSPGKFATTSPQTGPHLDFLH